MIDKLAAQTLAMFTIIARRNRAENILAKINERSIERRIFATMLGK